MASISRTYGPATADPVATNSTVLAAHINTDLDTIYSEFNGNIDNANIKSSAAIAISKTTLGTYTAPANTTAPTWGAGGGGSYGTVTNNRYVQTQIGKVNTIEIKATGTITGVVTNVNFDGPTAPASGVEECPVLVGSVKETDGSVYPCTAVWSAASSSWKTYKDNRAVFAAGANTIISVSGSYLVS